MRCGNYLCICIWCIYIYVCIMKTGEGEEEYEIGGRDVMHRRTITRGEESENDRDDDDVDGDDFDKSDVVVRDSNKEVMKRNKNVKNDEKTESMDTIDDDYLIMTENDGDDEKEEAKKKEKKEYGLERTVKNVRASEGSRLTSTTAATSATSNDDKSVVTKKPSRPSLGFSTRGVPATELLSTVIGSLRKQSKALIDALAKGRDDAEDIFDKVSESIEETKIALDSIDVKSEEIRNGLREICASTYYVDRKKKS